MEAINLKQKLSLFDEQWSPKIITNIDDYEVKLAKIEGDFIWHMHQQEDEMFLVLKGHLTLAFRDHTVELDEGEMCVVPKGVEHKPSTVGECHLLLIERKGVRNTGEHENERTQEHSERI